LGGQSKQGGRRKLVDIGGGREFNGDGVGQTYTSRKRKD
jgi:hypothetical protein